MTNLSRLIAVIFIVFGIICIAGCQTLTAPSSPDRPWSPPKKISSSPDKEWRSLREKNIPKAGPLSLADLIDIALGNNPKTRSAWASAKAEEARKKQEEGALYPQAKVSFAATRQRTYPNMSLDFAQDNYLKYGPSLQITYLLLDFGGRGANIEEASQLLISANYQFNRAIQDAVLATEEAYYGLHSARAALEATEADLKNARVAYDAAQNRYEVGLAAKLDVFQAKSNYEQSLYALEDAKGQVKAAEAELAKSLGYPADTKMDIVVPSKELPEDVTDEDMTAIINDAIEQRPDLAALRADLRAKGYAISSARSDLLPSISGGGSLNSHKYKYFSNAQSLSRDKSYTAYISLDWDIFDGFANLNRVREAEADYETQRSDLIEAEVGASAEVWTKYFDYKTALKKLEYSEAFLGTAQTSYELALESYKTGIKSILDLLDAESRLSDARSNVIESRKDVFISLAELAHATGTIYTGGEKNE